MHPADLDVQLPIKNIDNKNILGKPADPKQTPHAVGQYKSMAPIG